jgi:hypothetical protein
MVIQGSTIMSTVGTNGSHTVETEILLPYGGYSGRRRCAAGAADH